MAARYTAAAILNARGEGGGGEVMDSPCIMPPAELTKVVCRSGVVVGSWSSWASGEGRLLTLSFVR